MHLVNLNEDVLRVIMDLAVHSHEHNFYEHILQSPQTAISISHVSRRFRLLALSSSTLWTNLHGFMLPEAMLAFLERSRDADLCIVFVLDNRHVRSLNDDGAAEDDDLAGLQFRYDLLFDAASPHSKRWRSIHVLPNFNAVSEGFQPFLHWQGASLRCSLALQDGPFPRLQYLDARFDEPIPLHKGFYAGWDASALRELVIANAPPSILHFAAISKFTFVWDQWSPQNVSIETELLAFLLATPSLEDLCFRIDRSGIGLLNFAALRLEAALPLELPNIKTLSLFSVSFSTAPTFQALLDRLRLPNLSRLAIHVGMDRHGRKVTTGPFPSNLQTFIWVLSMFPDPAYTQLLKDVELRLFVGADHGARERQFQLPFVKLEHVENLTLETDMRLVWSYAVDSHHIIVGSWTSDSDLLALVNVAAHPINLKSLRLERCPRVDAQFVTMLTEIMRQQGSLKNFKGVTVLQCDPALEETLETFIPRD
ncbi:hypothetical protein SCHPADRAFT_22469 [Schizopora paradoxa]|uniref:F-box domain-containing protein n=1 Tax=Schizopora paradoxa TaxID=27342 RepID=A0A0H2S910_9AGAM|nr:hypothetical protein SCHPADRAFT_22469 [Schizopora paradoxa]